MALRTIAAPKRGNRSSIPKGNRLPRGFRVVPADPYWQAVKKPIPLEGHPGFFVIAEESTS